MHRNTKVATCCYCNTRAALVLDGHRHELTCRSCGAPLHKLKMLPIESAPSRPKPVKSAAHPAPPRASHKATPKHPQRRPKKRKSTLRWILSEAFDAIEDVVDDIFD